MIARCRLDMCAHLSSAIAKVQDGSTSLQAVFNLNIKRMIFPQVSKNLIEYSARQNKLQKYDA